MVSFVMIVGGFNSFAKFAHRPLSQTSGKTILLLLAADIGLASFAIIGILFSNGLVPRGSGANAPAVLKAVLLPIGVVGLIVMAYCSILYSYWVRDR